MKKCRFFEMESFHDRRLVFKGPEAGGEKEGAKPVEGGKEEPEDKLNSKEEEQAKKKLDEIKKTPAAKGKLAEAQKTFKEKYEQLKKLSNKETGVEDKRKDCVSFLRTALKEGMEEALRRQEQLNVLKNPEELKALQDYMLKGGINTALTVDNSLLDWQSRESKWHTTNLATVPGYADKWNATVDQRGKLNAAIQAVYKLRDTKNDNAGDWLAAYTSLKAAVGKAPQGQISYAKLEGAAPEASKAGPKPAEKKEEKPKVVPKPEEKKKEVPKPMPAPKPPEKKGPSPNELIAKQKAEKEEKERLAKEKAEKERLAKEKAEKDKAEKERLAREKAEKDKAEKERLAKEKADKEKKIAEKPTVEVAKAMPVAVEAQKPKLGEPKIDEQGRKYFDNYDSMNVYMRRTLGAEGMRDVNRKLRMSADTIVNGIKNSPAGDNDQINAPVNINVEGNQVAFTMEIPKAKANVNKLASAGDVYRIQGVKFVLRQAAPSQVVSEVKISA